MRVSKEHWYNAGGFSNRYCWRKQSKSGGWMYFINY